MAKVNALNERVKWNFYRWLREADGCCELTVNNIESAILLWQESTKNEDFGLFSVEKAVGFKKWLEKREFRGKPLSIVTAYGYLRSLQKFFKWLAREKGFKSRIKLNDVDYLSINRKEGRVATQGSFRDFPAFDYVKNLVNSITIQNEIDQRDRALICFTLLSGMRDKAIATLPLGCFNHETLVITQNPRKGVETKFSKWVPTTLFRFDEEMVGYVLEWLKHLEAKGFSTKAPLFPRSKLSQGKGQLTFEKATQVEPKFWQGTGAIREIFKRRSENAKLPYHHPHTFRHLAVMLALKACKS